MLSVDRADLAARQQSDLAGLRAAICSLLSTLDVVRVRPVRALVLMAAISSVEKAETPSVDMAPSCAEVRHRSGRWSEP